MAELKYEVQYLEKKLYDKIYDAAFNQDPITPRSIDSPKKSETCNKNLDISNLLATKKDDDKLRAYIEKLIKKCEHLEAKYNFYKELVEQKQFLSSKNLLS